MRLVCIIGAIVFLIIIIILYKPNTRTVYINGTQYNIIPECYVCRETPSVKEKANILADINIKIIFLIKHIKNKYGKDHLYVENLINRYNPDVIYEHSPNVIHPEIAYTMNKGRSLHICISHNGKIQDTNDIMFVMLHEIAHVATNIKNHPREYWLCFRFILENAVEAGIYTPTNYMANPVYYCGVISLSHNPLYDRALDDYDDITPK
jgi:hypothetical protein